MADGGFSTDQGQRVDPDGRVSYDFTGHIHAQGLDLDESTFNEGDPPTPPADRKVRWLRESDGAVVAEIYTYEVKHPGIPGTRATWLQTYNDETGAGVPLADTIISSSNTYGESKLVVEEGYIGRVDAVADGASVRIIDGNGDSDFARTSQLAGLVQARLTWGDGRAIITDGVSEVSDEIVHPLGVVPASAVGTAIVTADGRDDYVVTLNSADDTSLYFNVRGAAAEHSPLANPTEVHFYWAAIAPYP